MRLGIHCESWFHLAGVPGLGVMTIARSSAECDAPLKQDISALMQALKLYRLDNLAYPSTEQGLQALVVRPATPPVPPNWKAGGYLERLPKDPWQHDYRYLNPGLHGDIDVFSFGADGEPGGEGVNADIGSWNQ